MTEAEWLASTDPRAMLVFLRNQTSERKLRLLAVACCRRIWSLISNEQGRHLVEVVERYADGSASDEELDAADGEHSFAPPDLSFSHNDAVAAYAHEAVEQTARHSEAYYAQLRRGRRVRRARGAAPPNSPGWESAAGASDQASATAAALAVDTPDWLPRRNAERAAQCLLIRDVFGNPFRPVTITPAVLSWNDATVRRIAEGIYEERRLPDGTLDGARLAILSDALLDADCDNEDLIAHCRSPGPHVRGCWALDQILEKT
jgi:hypothetical protein